MTDERGTITYLIFHDDFSALQFMADSHAGILGVEQHVGNHVARMAFESAQSPLKKGGWSIGNCIDIDQSQRCHAVSPGRSSKSESNVFVMWFFIRSSAQILYQEAPGDVAG